MKIKALVAAVALGTMAGSAMAATDGVYGATSTGSAIITATVGNFVRISAVQDVTLTALGGWTATGNACVFNNQGASYNVTLTGNGVGGAFDLAGPGGAQAYTVTWNGTGATSGTAFAAAGASQVADCGAPGNTNASYTISSATVGAALAGVYTDTLTILIAP